MPKKPDLTDEDQALRERLGAALRLSSSARGIKPADMASAGGVSLAHQYRIEAGERTPDALYLFKVCRHMGVTMDSLFRDAATVEPAPTGAPGRVHQSGGLHQQNTGNNNIQIGSVGGARKPKR